MNAIINLDMDSVWQAYTIQLRNFCENKLQNIKQDDPHVKIYKRFLAHAYFNYAFIEKEDNHDRKEAIASYRKSLKIREEIGDVQEIPSTLINIAVIYNEEGNTSLALEYYFKSADMCQKLGNKKELSTSWNNIGSTYQKRANVEKALEYYFKSRKICEEMGDKGGLAAVLNNIGYVYKVQRDYKSGLEYFEKSLKIREEEKDYKNMAVALNNVAVSYSDLGNYDKSLEYHFKNLALLEKQNNQEMMGRCLNNIGGDYVDKGDYKNAVLYMDKGLKMREKIHDKRGTANSLYCFSRLYVIFAEKEKSPEAKRKNLKIAEDYCTRSLKLCLEVNSPELIESSAHQLSIINKKLGDHKKALENFKLHVLMRDSVSNEKSRKASIKSALQYDYEKQAAKDSVAHAKETEIKNAKLARQTAEIKTKKNQQYALFGGLILVVIFAGIMYNRFRVTQKQKVIIEAQEKETQKQNEIISQQKHLVEEKQKEIVDSIKYARRIQTALITNEKYITKNLDRLKNL
ncbi:MAG: protein serine/threonine phosphatase [Bacteroidetes bacterium]|jgi:tetratricopeptide (TPR) repeat protein|nr:protein serine/threonine phosphatase [Bacteroidota bacterium]